MSRPRIAALLVAVGLATGLSSPALARTVHGAQLPEPLSPIPGDGTGTRFVAPTQLEKVLKGLRRTYGRTEGVVIRRLRAPLRVTVYLVENLRPNRSWDAINVYEDTSSRTVYLTVLPAEGRSRGR